MSVPEKVERPERPLLAKDRFDIPPNSWVKVVTNQGYVMEGNCYQNPIHTNSTDSIEMVNVDRFDPHQNRKDRAQYQQFFREDIASLDFTPPPKVFDPAAIPERLMSTKIVGTEPELMQMFQALQPEKAIGLGFFGVNVCRDGEVGWICICTHGLLISIDVIELERVLEVEFWDLMEKHVFHRTDLVKVVHNIRPMADFYFHKKARKIKNYFCTQLGEMYIRYHMNRDEKWPKDCFPEEDDPEKKCNWLLKPLSYCLEEFLPETANKIELAYLKRFESHDYSLKNLMMDRPINTSDGSYKCCAIAMKYLLDLYEAQMKRMMSHFSQVVTSQAKVMYAGDMGRYFLHINDPSYLDLKVQDAIKGGQPLIFDNQE